MGETSSFLNRELWSQECEANLSVLLFFLSHHPPVTWSQRHPSRHKSIHHEEVWLTVGRQGCLNIWKPIYVRVHKETLKERNHMIISTDTKRHLTFINNIRFQLKKGSYKTLQLIVCVCVHAHTHAHMCACSVVPNSWDPEVCSLPGSSVHGDSPAKNTGVGCHFPSPRDLPDPGIEPMALASPALAGRFFTTSTIREAHRT